MMKRISIFVLFFMLFTGSVFAKSKNVFSQILSGYLKYQEVNMLLWLSGDVHAERRFGEELRFWQGLTVKVEKDKAINAYVRSIFDRLAPHYDHRGMKWTLTVIKDNNANAYVIPGGHVYILTGMLNMVNSDDELAAVMAHELAHAQMRHSLKNFRTSAIMVEILKRAVKNKKDRESWGTILAYLSLMKFSRTQEDEADDIGQVKMAAAGFNPSAQVSLWEKFLKKYGETSGLMGYLSSHPSSSSRVQNAKNNLKKMNIAYSEEFTNTRHTFNVPVTKSLIVNPSFEDAKTKQGGISGWTVDKGAFELSTAQKRTGKNSLESKAFDRMVLSRIFTDYIAINQKTKLDFKGFVKGLDGNQRYAIGIELYDVERKLRDRHWVKTTDMTKTDWTEVRSTIVNDKNATVFKANHKYMRVFLQTGPGNTGSVWFDDLELIAR
jgi:Zn-dependent protease with chaperone function